MERSAGGLLALYDFASANGDVVRDRSGIGAPADLKIANPRVVRRRPGALEVTGNTVIRTNSPPAKILDAIRKSGAMSLETWIEPKSTRQSGPARIVTISRDTGQRNLTLGQDGDRYDVRFRTDKTSTNGIPSLGSKTRVTSQLSHVVYTRNRAGRTRIFVDGRQSAESRVSGTPRNWDGGYNLALANEFTNDRGWLGTFHLVALYGRELHPAEVERHFRAGPNAAPGARGLLAGENREPGSRLFEHKIAPLLSQHCLECHDSLTKEGKLDLSQKSLAFAGGKGGKAIVPGKLAESALWEAVEHDDMPEDRDPLSAAEKTLLREWILAGAPWTLETIDPAIYAHSGKEREIWVQRLTVGEYIETVRSAVGVDISREAREHLPPDLRADGFSNTAYNLNVDLKHVDAYARLADIIVDHMDVRAFAERFGRTGSLEDKPVRELIGKMGQVAPARPVGGNGAEHVSRHHHHRFRGRRRL